MKGYPHDGFDLQRAHEMFSTANIRLYEGRGAPGARVGARVVAGGATRRSK